MLDDRAERLSGASDELWDDDTIVVHLNEGQRLLCEEAWVLEDTTTPEVCQIQLTEGVTDYTLHPSVMGVKYARLSDSVLDLLRVNYFDNHLHNWYPAQEPGFWDVNAAFTETPGRPTRWSADVGIRVMRVRSVPDATAAALQVNLAVARMPVTDLTTAAPTAEPEVSKEHHHTIALYAAAMCAMGSNVDANIQAKGKDWMAQFDARVERAKKYRRRQQNATPRFRCGAWASDGCR